MGTFRGKLVRETVGSEENDGAPRGIQAARWHHEFLLPRRSYSDTRYNAPTAIRGGSEIHMCPDTQRGFRNYATPPHREPSAKPARERAIAFRRKHLA